MGSLRDDPRESFLAALRRGGARRGRGEALLVLAPDGFSRLADALGHAQARGLLAEIGARLQLCAPGLPSAQVGEHEFALLVPLPPGERAPEAAWEELQPLLALPFCGVWGESSLRFSAGFAEFGAREGDPERRLDAARAALHQAQASGGGRCLRYEAGILREARLRVALERDLGRAIERRELRVHYQPVIDCGSGELRGLEALVRWQRPGRGWIAPERFVPLSEQCGLIHELGEFVLREVLAQRERWRRSGSALAQVHVSLNVSARQLDDERFLRSLESAARAGELGGTPLWLELTETALLADDQAVRERLLRMRALGLRLALDDLGTGYSSLLELRRLPLDALKLDRRLTQDVGSDARSTRLFEAICALARSLPMCLVAEGIETEAQLAVLRRQGCMLAQGFLWSPALPAGELESWSQCRFRHSA
jgi:predicted signal transduction protein with EAL and GGDEF domain